MKKKLSALLAAALCFALALPCAFVTSAAEEPTESLPFAARDEDGYDAYLASSLSNPGTGEIKIAGVSGVPAAGAAASGDAIQVGSKGRADWSFDVAAAGQYELLLNYDPLGDATDPIETEIYIDGKLPFSEASSVFFPRYWENDGDLRTDPDGNEFAPNVKQVEGFFTLAASDPSGFHNGAFLFSLSAGRHTVSLAVSEGEFAIKEIIFRVPEKLPSYKEYLKSADASDYTGEPLVTEGEAAAMRSKKAIVPLSDNTTEKIQPQNAFIGKLNYIGGGNYNRPGDTIVWNVTAPKTGYYALSFSYRQKYTINETFYRTLKIDGEVPFSEAETVPFVYTGGFSECAFSDEDDEPYKIYLTEGEHTLSLTVTMGPIASLCGELDALVYELAGFYRSMVMITGENPDAVRDYNLFTQIEDYDGRLKSYVETLDRLLDELYEITGSTSGSAPANLRNMRDVLQRMRDNKYYAHQYKNRYYDNYAALSAWVYERASMALDIDGIFLCPPSDPETGRSVGIFRRAGFSIRRFFASFASTYHASSSGEGEVTLWINWGRDQAKILKTLAGGFDKGKVNIRVTNATLLQGILSGNGPDCAIQIPRSEPLNLAMRGGLYDLSQFDDYKEITERFMPDADLPYRYEGGCFGLPNTQTFYMLFYRTDIFEQLGLTVPETWDDFLEVSNRLLRRNMKVGLPYTQITDMSQVNTGVGALNIFPTLLMQRGLSLYSEDGRSCTLNTPETTEVFVEWTDFYNKYGLDKTYDFYSRFRVGLMPMAIQSYTLYATLSSAAPEISEFWRMTKIPGVRREDGTIDRTVSGGGTAAVILKDAEDPALAWEFLKWWTSADVQYSYASEVENMLGTAARHDSANVEALCRLSWGRDNLSALQEQWKQVKEIPEIPGSYYLARVIDQAFWNTTNGKDPYEMTEKWGKIADNELKRKEEQYGSR